MHDFDGCILVDQGVKHDSEAFSGVFGPVVHDPGHDLVPAEVSPVEIYAFGELSPHLVDAEGVVCTVLGGAFEVFRSEAGSEVYYEFGWQPQGDEIVLRLLDIIEPDEVFSHLLSPVRSRAVWLAGLSLLWLEACNRDRLQHRLNLCPQRLSFPQALETSRTPGSRPLVRAFLASSLSIMLRPMNSTTCGTHPFPSDLSRSTRAGTPSTTRPTSGSNPHWADPSLSANLRRRLSVTGPNAPSMTRPD